MRSWSGGSRLAGNDIRSAYLFQHIYKKQRRRLAPSAGLRDDQICWGPSRPPKWLVCSTKNKRNFFCINALWGYSAEFRGEFCHSDQISSMWSALPP